MEHAARFARAPVVGEELKLLGFLRRHPILAWAGAWTLAHVGYWVGLLASYLLPDLLENTLDLTESGIPELTLGWALGGAIGGSVAAVPGVAVRSLLKARAAP